MNITTQINDLHTRAHKMRELAKYANDRDFKAEMAEAERLEYEALFLEKSDKKRSQEYER